MGENVQLWGWVAGSGGVREKEQRNTWRGDEWLSVGEKQRCMNGGVEGSELQRQTGQLEYEELACDGSCPGLILSVYSG